MGLLENFSGKLFAKIKMAVQNMFDHQGVFVPCRGVKRGN